MLYVEDLLSDSNTLRLPIRPGFRIPDILTSVIVTGKQNDAHVVGELQEDTTVTLRFLHHLDRVCGSHYLKSTRLRTFYRNINNEDVSHNIGACCDKSIPSIFDLTPYIMAAQKLLGDRPYIAVRRGDLHREIRRVKRELGYTHLTYKCMYCAANAQILLSRKILRWVGLYVWNTILKQCWNSMLTMPNHFWLHLLSSHNTTSQNTDVLAFIDALIRKGVLRFDFNISQTVIIMYSRSNLYFKSIFGLSRCSIQEATRRLNDVDEPSPDSLSTIWHRFNLKNIYNHTGG